VTPQPRSTHEEDQLETPAFLRHQPNRVAYPFENCGQAGGQSPAGLVLRHGPGSFRGYISHCFDETILRVDGHAGRLQAERNRDLVSNASIIIFTPDWMTGYYLGLSRAGSERRRPQAASREAGSWSFICRTTIRQA